MSDLPAGMKDYVNLQERVLTALGQQMTEGFREIGRRLDVVTDDSKHVAERLARIEGMQVGNAQELKDVKEDLKAAKADSRESSEKVNKLENRLVRLETLIVPAASLLAAAASALAGHFIK